MKVLVVDDDQIKMSALIVVLVDKCAIARECIETASNVVDAKRLLRDDDYDLLILDILLPQRVETAPTMESSLELLKDIHAGRKVRQPRHVVGLTAYSEAKADVEQDFQKYLWTVLYYDQTSSEWLNSIQNCISYLRARAEQEPLNEYGTDLCILTALADPEESCVLNLPWEWQAPEPLDASLFVRKGTFRAAEQQHSVVVAHAPRMGMVSSALTAAKLIDRYRPRFLVMSGICAGYRGKVNVGDVILADPSWDYQSGKRGRKADEPTFEIDPHQIPVPVYVRSRVEQMRGDGALWADIKRGWPGNKPDTELQLHMGPVASGSAVLNDHEIIQDIRNNQSRKLLGVEMEIYGVYLAASLATGPRPTAFALKSVCDYADGEKNDDFQRYAAYTSAQAVKTFFERYYQDIFVEAGRM